MNVHPYSSSVRVGNWNEEIQMEEDTLKDFLDKRDRGELLIQKTGGLKEQLLRPETLSTSRTGGVHFGDVVMFINPEPKDVSRGDTCLSVNIQTDSQLTQGVNVCCSPMVAPVAKSAFVITSFDGTHRSEPLRFGQPFYICTPDRSLFLVSDRTSFTRCAHKSRQCDVRFVPEPSHLAEWRCHTLDPKFRMELDHTQVPANQPLVIYHVKTNQALAMEKDHLVRTMFGKEHEVTCHTLLDSHRFEESINHWKIVMQEPGDRFCPVQMPAETVHHA